MEQRYILDYKVIGQRIKQARRLAGITQAELAESIHISANHIAKLETSKAAASLETIVNISNSLGTDINCLLSSKEAAQTQDYIDLLITGQLREFTQREKEALLLVINAMRACKIS
ncbi:MAG: helix-turn-helix domain-containing protein [Oscillospiraceae bacterium]|nr:helix-turn-helix domain-containing protein [Oscillospiraceae bacterium]